MPDARIVVPDARIYVVELESDAIIVELGTSGPQGPPGESVGILEVSHTHNQAVASDTWTINHNLGFYPNITVVDSSGNVVEGSYTYQDEKTIIASFSGAFSGKAYLS